MGELQLDPIERNKSQSGSKNVLHQVPTDLTNTKSNVLGVINAAH